MCVQAGIESWSHLYKHHDRFIVAAGNVEFRERSRDWLRHDIPPHVAKLIQNDALPPSAFILNLAPGSLSARLLGCFARDAEKRRWG
jgi:hypothetical protein